MEKQESALLKPNLAFTQEFLLPKTIINSVSRSKNVWMT